MFTQKITALMAASALALSIGLIACGGSQAPAATQTVAPTQAAAPATQEKPEKKAPAQAAAPAQSAAPAQAAAPTQAAAPAATQNSYIGDQAAIAAALSHAGLAATDVYDLDCELDLDDATVHYDVDFKAGGMEYDYDIDATTGAILFSNAEVDD